MNNMETDYINLINLLSFYIGLVNLKENLTQSDKQELENVLSNKIERYVNSIQNHLQIQDRKIDRILEILGVEDDV